MAGVFLYPRHSPYLCSRKTTVATPTFPQCITDIKAKEMKQYFNSNETLEMCDVKVSQNGGIEIKTKCFHSAELARLGKPKRSVRGRMQMAEADLVFAPYGEGARKPVYQQQIVVGSTTLSVTEEKVKVSFLVPRHLTKALMTMYIQSEIDEVKRRLDTDVYDRLAIKEGGER